MSWGSVLHEKWRSKQLSETRQRSVQERLKEANQAVDDVGKQPYNDALALASRQLQMSVRDLIEDWEFECDGNCRKTEVDGGTDRAEKLPPG